MPNVFSTNPYAVPYGTQQALNQNPPQSSLVWVNGEDGAKNYPVARGNTILLLDSQDSSFYLKSMDLTGAVSLRKFKFEEVLETTVIEDKNKEEVDMISQLTNNIDSTNNILKDLQDLVLKFQNETVEQMSSMEDKLNRLEIKTQWKNKTRDKEKGKVNE